MDPNKVYKVVTYRDVAVGDTFTKERTVADLIRSAALEQWMRGDFKSWSEAETTLAIDHAFESHDEAVAFLDKYQRLIDDLTTTLYDDLLAATIGAMIEFEEPE